MKRGMLSLSPDQVKISLQALAASTPHPLTNKLKAAANQANPVVEVSEQEVEVLLDVLPPPSPDQPNLTETRQHIQSFLLKLRGT